MIPTFQELLSRRKTVKHYGVKGMKWGVRKSRGRDRNAPQPVDYKQKKNGEIKTRGGKNIPAHEDAIKSNVAKRVARSSSTNALSDEQLRQLVNRMNLEQQFRQLNEKDLKAGRSVISELLEEVGKDYVSGTQGGKRKK